MRVVFESFNLFLGMDVDIKNFNIILRACTERGTVLQSTALLIHYSLRFFCICFQIDRCQVVFSWIVGRTSHEIRPSPLAFKVKKCFLRDSFALMRLLSFVTFPSQPAPIYTPET